MKQNILRFLRAAQAALLLCGLLSAPAFSQDKPTDEAKDSSPPASASAPEPADTSFILGHSRLDGPSRLGGSAPEPAPAGILDKALDKEGNDRGEDSTAEEAKDSSSGPLSDPLEGLAELEKHPMQSSELKGVLMKKGDVREKYRGQDGQALFADTHYNGDKKTAYDDISAALTKSEFLQTGWQAPLPGGTNEADSGLERLKAKAQEYAGIIEEQINLLSSAQGLFAHLIYASRDYSAKAAQLTDLQDLPSFITDQSSFFHHVNKAYSPGNSKNDTNFILSYKRAPFILKFFTQLVLPSLSLAQQEATKQTKAPLEKHAFYKAELETASSNLKDKKADMARFKEDYFSALALNNSGAVQAEAFLSSMEETEALSESIAGLRADLEKAEKTLQKAQEVQERAQGFKETIQEATGRLMDACYANFATPGDPDVKIPDVKITGYI